MELTRKKTQDVFADSQIKKQAFKMVAAGKNPPRQEADRYLLSMSRNRYLSVVSMNVSRDGRYYGSPTRRTRSNPMLSGSISRPYIHYNKFHQEGRMRKHTNYNPTTYFYNIDDFYYEIATASSNLLPNPLYKDMGKAERAACDELWSERAPFKEPEPAGLPPYGRKTNSPLT